MGKHAMCDGAHCVSSHGGVRRMPTTGGAAVILCHACYEHEIGWRKERNLHLAKEARFLLPRWESLELAGADGVEEPVVDNVVTEGFPRLEIRDSKTQKILCVIERGHTPKHFRIHLAAGLEAHVFQGDPPKPVKVVKQKE